MADGAGHTPCAPGFDSRREDHSDAKDGHGVRPGHDGDEKKRQALGPTAGLRLGVGHRREAHDDPPQRSARGGRADGTGGCVHGQPTRERSVLTICCKSEAFSLAARVAARLDERA